MRASPQVGARPWISMRCLQLRRPHGPPPDLFPPNLEIPVTSSPTSHLHNYLRFHLHPLLVLNNGVISGSIRRSQTSRSRSTPHNLPILLNRSSFLVYRRGKNCPYQSVHRSCRICVSRPKRKPLQFRWYRYQRIHSSW